MITTYHWIDTVTRTRGKRIYEGTRLQLLEDINKWNRLSSVSMTPRFLYWVD